MAAWHRQVFERSSRAQCVRGAPGSWPVMHIDWYGARAHLAWLDRFAFDVRMPIIVFRWFYACFARVNAEDTDLAEVTGTKTAPPTTSPENTDPPTTTSEDTDTRTTPTTMTEGEFIVLFPERLCIAYESCNSDIDCQNGPSNPKPNCTFHPDRAAACTYGDFVCNTQFGQGFEFIEVPEVCSRVYTDCPNDDTGAVSTGTTGP